MSYRRGLSYETPCCEINRITKETVEVRDDIMLSLNFTIRIPLRDAESTEAEWIT